MKLSMNVYYMFPLYTSYLRICLVWIWGHGRTHLFTALTPLNVVEWDFHWIFIVQLCTSYFRFRLETFCGFHISKHGLCPCESRDHLLSVAPLTPLIGIEWNFHWIFMKYSHCAPPILDFDSNQYEGLTLHVITWWSGGYQVTEHYSQFL